MKSALIKLFLVMQNILYLKLLKHWRQHFLLQIGQSGYKSVRM